MKRIQAYASEKLWKRLEEHASDLGVTKSALVVDILEEYYGLTSKELTKTQLTKKVLDEVKNYIDTLEPTNEAEFDLLSASSTFKTIPVTCMGKPNPMRAQIGRAFAKQVGSGSFYKIEAVKKDNNEIKKSENNATLYRIKKI